MAKAILGLKDALSKVARLINEKNGFGGFMFVNPVRVFDET